MQLKNILKSQIVEFSMKTFPLTEIQKLIIFCIYAEICFDLLCKDLFRQNKKQLFQLMQFMERNPHETDL